MEKKIIAYFDEKQSADEAVKGLREKGFGDNDISIISKEENKDTVGENGNQILADGTIAGAAYGSIAGFALVAGAALIPGIGPVVAAGPVAGMIAGAVTGGLAGALIDYGLPEEQGRYYESKVEEGKLLIVMRTEEEKAEAATETLKTYGAREIEVH